MQGTIAPRTVDLERGEAELALRTVRPAATQPMRVAMDAIAARFLANPG